MHTSRHADCYLLCFMEIRTISICHFWFRMCTMWLCWFPNYHWNVTMKMRICALVVILCILVSNSHHNASWKILDSIHPVLALATGCKVHLEYSFCVSTRPWSTQGRILSRLRVVGKLQLIWVIPRSLGRKHLYCLLHPHPISYGDTWGKMEMNPGLEISGSQEFSWGYLKFL